MALLLKDMGIKAKRHVIEFESIRFHHIREMIRRFIKLRVIAYGHIGHFVKAFKDIHQLSNLHPATPDLFLWASQLCLIRGFKRRALEKEDEVPLEIADHILGHLNPVNNVLWPSRSLLTVSKAWRSRILNSPTLWSYTDAFYMFGENNAGQNVINAIHRFSNILPMSINQIGYHPTSCFLQKQFPAAYVISILPLPESEVISIEECSFSWFQSVSNEEEESPDTLEQLLLEGKDIADYTLQMILGLCPHLKYFEIHGYRKNHGERITRIFRQHCHNLHYFVSNTPIPSPNNDSERLISHILSRYTDYRVSFSARLSLLSTYSNTLKKLDLLMDKDPADTWATNPLVVIRRFTFPALRKLMLTITNECLDYFVKAAPRLERLIAQQCRMVSEDVIQQAKESGRRLSVIRSVCDHPVILHSVGSISSFGS
ncbi:hypothetical protein BDA99DRAFT_573633 [Phascolomyces articulosus]|uniref:F-box domain-containing protein n=1 Tax=Phascolomyces articulosus TaxID=60185 RepID=A0AAD5K6S9_9FUNG|nr:hypothetical protein BDA99DRAFT_573633 [Phascolomyces articulosus]